MARQGIWVTSCYDPHLNERRIIPFSHATHLFLVLLYLCRELPVGLQDMIHGVREVARRNTIATKVVYETL